MTTSRKDKAKSVKAFAVARRGEIDTNSIEPFTDDGRNDLIKRINRPAGERVITIRITDITP